MQVDSSVLIGLMLNVGLLLALTWLGVSFFSTGSFNLQQVVPGHDSLIQFIINQRAVILPRLKKNRWRVRKLIKSESGDDETPFDLSRF